MLQGLLAGDTYATIAKRLGISVQAVNYHANQIYREHGLTNAADRPRPRPRKCRQRLIAMLAGADRRTQAIEAAGSG